MLDLERIKQDADLLAICERDTRLKKVANTAGGEWAGPCPLCGHTPGGAQKDGFRVQPQANPPRWMCRKCGDGHWHSAIDYIARRDGLDFADQAQREEICRRVLGRSDLPTATGPRPAPLPPPAYQPPALDWQAAARQVIDACEQALWSPRCATVLAYLRGRGLSDATIRRFRLGYCATGDRKLMGREIAGLYVPRGILIPCVVEDEVWYLKIRLMPGVPCKCQKCGGVLETPGDCPRCGENNKYRGVKGNRPAAIFNADSLRGADVALFCEGEFDGMIAHQVMGKIIPAVTLGSATNRPDLAIWGLHLLPLKAMLVAYDSDTAGAKGAEVLASLSNRVRRLALPAGAHDINDFYLAGGDLWQWLLPVLQEVDPAPGDWRAWGQLVGAQVCDYAERLFAVAEQALAAGDVAQFARTWAWGMVATGDDPAKWAEWAETEYQVPAGEVLAFARSFPADCQ